METINGVTDSNELSNLSSICRLPSPSSLELSTAPISAPVPSPEYLAFRRLSENLDLIFLSPEFEPLADGEIIAADGREVAVNKCILAARSLYFKNLFLASRQRVKAKFEMRKLAKEHEVGYDSLVVVLGYLYSGKVKAFPKELRICADEECMHVGCRPAVELLLEMLYASFVFQVDELVSLFKRQLLNILDKVAVDDILVVLKVANICNKACDKLLEMCIQIIVQSDVDFVTIDKLLPQHIVKQITDSRLKLPLDKHESQISPNIHVKRIYKAMESDDVELVRMLLKEGHTNLDDAYALHYSVAFSDPKVTTGLLDLGLADVNRKNSRGFSVLHIAAMRKEPHIIASLVTKGARPFDLTPDGRNALQISKRVTRAADYLKSPEEGKATPNDRLCVEILEQAQRNDPLLGETSHSLAIAGDDLRTKLLYLENRVGLARLLFPMEAKIVMNITQVDGTPEFSLADLRSNKGKGSQTTVDLNVTPLRMKQKHLLRLKALSRTAELANRFFPRCTGILNNIMMDADDLSQLAYLGNDTPEELRRKKRRFIELQEVVKEAFNEDKAAFDKSSMSSPSSCESIAFFSSKRSLNHKA